MQLNTDLTPETMQLKLADITLEPDTKLLSDFAIVKDGTVLQLFKTVTAASAHALITKNFTEIK